MDILSNTQIFHLSGIMFMSFIISCVSKAKAKFLDMKLFLSVVIDTSHIFLWGQFTIFC